MPDDLQRAARRSQSGSSCNAPRSMRHSYKHWQRRAAGGRAAQGVRHGQHHCQVRAPDRGAALHRALATSWACKGAPPAEGASQPRRARQTPALCRAGSGGRGEVVAKGAGRTVRNFKYRARSSTPKQIFLPAAAPADGAEGASVVCAPRPPDACTPPAPPSALPPLCGAGCCVAVRSRGRRAGPGLVGSWTPRPGQTRCREGLRAAGLCCGRLVADPALDNLLHLHARPRLCGKGGAAGSPATGSAGPLCALGTLPEGLPSAALQQPASRAHVHGVTASTQRLEPYH